MNIIINNRQANSLNLIILEKQICKILKRLRCPDNVELSLILSDDSYIAQLNYQYRGYKKSTNVLAFSMREGDFTNINPWLLGDVVVSIDTAWREAKEFYLDFYEYFLRLIIHGILHLIGYDHQNNAQQEEDIEKLTESLLFLVLGT